MNNAAEPILRQSPVATTAIEVDFPIVPVSEVAEQESWRKEINRPLYHIHKWWATRLGSVFRAITLGALQPPGTDIWASFYQQHQLTGKVVLDPFMGSGTTIGEALKLGAKAIGNDINPVSTFLVRQAFTPVAEADLRAAFATLAATVAPEIQRYYQTTDPLTGERLSVLYYFWCKTVVTPTGEEIPLMSRYVFAQDAYPQKKPRAQIICPHCWGITVDRYDATSLACPHCGQTFNPQAGPAQGQFVHDATGARYRIKDLLPSDGTPPRHRLYAMLALRADGEKAYLPITPADLALYAEAADRLPRETLPLPTMAVRPGNNTDQARGYNYLHWHDFFNARQLLCLGLLLRAILAIPNTVVREQLICLFSSTLEFNNLFCSYKGEGTGAVRHMFSNHILKPERTPLENSIWGTAKSSGTFSTLFETRLLRAKSYLAAPFELGLNRDAAGKKTGSFKTVASQPLMVPHAHAWADFATTDQAVLILNGDSANLPIPAQSVDAVITDPPYFDFVHYSELSDFFFAWLAPALADRYPWLARANSADPGEVQHQDPRIFARQLAKVFTECHRVLKDEGVLAFSFHHSRPEGWAAIYEAITTAGFAVVAAHPVHAELRAASPKTAAKNPISLDTILVCRKQTGSQLPIDIQDTREIAAVFASRLISGGIKLSAADQFVIRAGLLLIPLSTHSFDYATACAELTKLTDS